MSVRVTDGQVERALRQRAFYERSGVKRRRKQRAAERRRRKLAQRLSA
jgi:ribosomal protein S21